MSILATVSDLVKRFEQNRESYSSSTYNETQLRREFLDPFFEALGWDVTNTQGYAEAYKEVIHEDIVKIGTATKAPDYSFRIGGVRKFFVEAKKPFVNIRDDISPAFQLRRYAWSAKLPLSILTDFEEFAVYDCRQKPEKADKASVGRILFFRFDEYETHWDDIASIFSKDAILKGSFDKFADSTKSKKGTSEVDEVFLSEIENWRIALAKNIALRNDNLSARDLNFAVQRTIDRLIFLRICEDRGTEDYGRLQAHLNGENIYRRLCVLFREADDRYNSGLFHFREEKGRGETPDNITLKLDIDDKVLKQIIQSLYYPDSPYEFSVLSADILGQVYEQFLGKVIRLTAGHQAKVEEKPEVKKSGGVYYTPPFIVNHIVKETIGSLLDKKAPREATTIRILDPACGSGSFLIGAYQFLLDWHRDWYTNNNPQKWMSSKQPPIYRHRAGEYRLSTPERKRILLNNIFGVDIDSQAVEVTKLSLLLKVLEGENEQTISQQLRLFHERALPDLGNNIKCGNSLIANDYYNGAQLSMFDSEERLRVNAFDWGVEFASILSKGGFDAVIGNPPYDVIEKDRGESSWPHSALVQYIEEHNKYPGASGGKLNLYRFFIVNSIDLVRPNGYFGMIIPLSLLADISCSKTRRYVFQTCRSIQTDCFPQKDIPSKRVFKLAKLSTAVICCQKNTRPRESDTSISLRAYPYNSFSDEARTCDLKLSEIEFIDSENLPVPIVSQPQWKVCQKIHRHKNVTPFGKISDVVINRGEINQTIFREFITSNSRCKRLLKGVEVGQFFLRDKLSQGEREWFDEKAFLAKNNPKLVSSKRRIATQRITGVDEALRIVAMVVDPPCYFADSTNSVCVDDGSKYTYEYLLALLNSDLFQWRFKLTSSNNNVATNELMTLPFRNIDFSSDSDCELFGTINSASQNLVQCYAGLNRDVDNTAIMRQIKSLRQKINDTVFVLYGLSEKDIEIIRQSQPAVCPTPLQRSLEHV